MRGSRLSLRLGGLPLAGLLGLTGCLRDAAVVRLPIDPGSSAAILIIRDPGQPPTAEALSFTGDAPAPEFLTVFSGIEGRQVDLFYYRCALAALALEPGPIDLSTDPSSGRALPLPSAARSGRIADGLLPGFEPITSTTSAGIRLAAPLPVASPCTSFTTVTALIPPADNGPRISFAVPVDTERALIGLDNGSFYLSSVSGLEKVALSSTTPHRAAFRAPDGELWLLGQGRTVHGRIGSNFVEAAPMISGGAGLLAVDGPPDGTTAFELFAAHESGVFEHYDGQSWSLLLNGPGGNTDGRIGVAWIGPGEAVAAGIDPSGISHAKGAETTLEVPPGFGPNKALSVLRTPTLGVVVGTQLGMIYQLSGGQWAPLFQPPPTEPVRRMAFFDGALIYGGRFGAAFQYHAGYGGCPSQNIVPGEIYAMLGVGDQLLVGGGPAGQTFVDHLSPSPKPPAMDRCPEPAP